MDRGVTISVVIPAYNAARFLPRCLNSVFAQTLQPVEVIVVDDGSTDNTAALAAALGARVVSQANGGVSAARNTGIRIASGDWLALLDADDRWAPEKLERQVARIRSKTVLVYTGLRIFDDNGVRSEQPATEVTSVRKMLRYHNPITPSTVLVRRKTILQAGGFREDIRTCEDWEMWTRLQHLGEFEVVKDSLTDYYVYPGSLSANPEQMLEGLNRFIDTQLLEGLHGFQRWSWRRRILAAQLRSATFISRDNALKGELRYIFRSLCAWPSPFLQPRRFRTFVISAINRFSPKDWKKLTIKSLILGFYRTFPLPVRRKISNLEKSCVSLALKMRMKPLRIDACLLGGDNGVPAANFARMVGDIRRASRPISEWPHVKLLRTYDSIGERIWEREVFEETDYFQNAALNIEIFGNYHGAVTPDQIHWGARRFVYAYRGRGEIFPLQEGETYVRDSEVLSVNPVKDSICYQVFHGHHRLAIAHMKGIREVRGLIRQPPVTTPVQDLLRDVLWLKGRLELYQPIDSPEVAGWVLVRHCSDRLAKMMHFLRAEGLMPPASSSYLDVASSYGWFVSEMAKAGFRAEGVERDPIAISVGQEMYGLKPEQSHRSDAVGFLRALQDRYDVTSCFSLAHHFILNRVNVSAEELLGLLDAATRRVMFFDMAHSHEEFYSNGTYTGWDSGHIQQWLKANTTFTRIVPLGEDEDAVPPFQKSFKRMLFACVR
jgi:glycosyltransferase involved in cell wall biosynthesis